MDIHRKYLLSNPNDYKWKLTINSVGCQEVGPGMPYPPSDHPSRYLFSLQKGRILNEYQLLYISKGKGVLYSETLGRNNGVQIGEGCFFMLFPGEWHSYYPDYKTGWEEYWIGFQGNIIEQLESENFFSKEVPVLPVGLNEEIISLYKKAIRTAVEQKSGYQQLLYGILNHLFGAAYFYNRNYSLKSSRVIDTISKARTLVNQNYSTITPTKLADSVNMGYSNFRKIFKFYTGFSPAQYILEVKMSKAKEMLTNTSLPIKEIAGEVGFEYFEYFFTVFKNKVGRTPTEYREMTQGINIENINF